MVQHEVLQLQSAFWRGREELATHFERDELRLEVGDEDRVRDALLRLTRADPSGSAVFSWQYTQADAPRELELARELLHLERPRFLERLLEELDGVELPPSCGELRTGESSEDRADHVGFDGGFLRGRVDGWCGSGVVGLAAFAVGLSGVVSGGRAKL